MASEASTPLVFTVELKPTKRNLDPTSSMKRFLKMALRSYNFRCVSIVSSLEPGAVVTDVQLLKAPEK